MRGDNLRAANKRWRLRDKIAQTMGYADHADALRRIAKQNAYKAKLMQAQIDDEKEVTK